MEYAEWKSILRWTAGVTLVCEGALTLSLPASQRGCAMSVGSTLRAKIGPALRWQV